MLARQWKWRKGTADITSSKLPAKNCHQIVAENWHPVRTSTQRRPRGFEMMRNPRYRQDLTYHKTYMNFWWCSKRSARCDFRMYIAPTTTIGNPMATL